MKKLPAFVLALFFSLGLAPQLTAASQFGGARERTQTRDRVCVYQDIQYQGWEQCYNAGDEVATLQRRNRAVSSIRIYGRARVTVYEDTEFRGHSAEFTSSIPDLGLRSLEGSKSWSDHIQSMRIDSDYDSRRDSSSRDDARRDRARDSSYGRTNSDINEGICVYDRPDYEGREQCWNADSEVSDLARAGNWSDRISSIRVLGRATAVLYRDIEFRGDRITVDRDIPDLSDLSGQGFRNWNRQASSLVVESDRGGFPGRGRARGRGRNR
jgi:hypothetical protein